jgi:hypothetical protein
VISVEAALPCEMAEAEVLLQVLRYFRSSSSSAAVFLVGINIVSSPGLSLDRPRIEDNPRGKYRGRGDRVGAKVPQRDGILAN